jgi:hypothetical protein
MFALSRPSEPSFYPPHSEFVNIEGRPTTSDLFPARRRARTRSLEVQRHVRCQDRTNWKARIRELDLTDLYEKFKL